MNQIHKRHRFASIMTGLMCALVWTGNCFAQSIVINDCHGFNRAVKQTQPGELNKVEVEVQSATGSPAEGTQVNLTNAVSGEVTTATAKGGVVSFEGLTSGIYTVSAVEQGVQIGAIWVGPMSAGVAVAGAAVVGAGAVGGAGIAGVASVADSVVNDSDDSDPTPAPQPTTPPVPTPIPVPTPTPCPECDPDAEPEPIDDFFKREETDPVQVQAQLLSPYR